VTIAVMIARPDRMTVIRPTLCTRRALLRERAAMGKSLYRRERREHRGQQLCNQLLASSVCVPQTQ